MMTACMSCLHTQPPADPQPICEKGSPQGVWFSGSLLAPVSLVLEGWTLHVQLRPDLDASTSRIYLNGQLLQGAKHTLDFSAGGVFVLHFELYDARGTPIKMADQRYDMDPQPAPSTRTPAASAASPAKGTAGTSSSSSGSASSSSTSASSSASQRPETSSSASDAPAVYAPASSAASSSTSAAQESAGGYLMGSASSTQQPAANASLPTTQSPNASSSSSASASSSTAAQREASTQSPAVSSSPSSVEEQTVTSRSEEILYVQEPAVSYSWPTTSKNAALPAQSEPSARQPTEVCSDASSAESSAPTPSQERPADEESSSSKAQTPEESSESDQEQKKQEPSELSDPQQKESPEPDIPPEEVSAAVVPVEEAISRPIPASGQVVSEAAGLQLETRIQRDREGILHLESHQDVLQPLWIQQQGQDPVRLYAAQNARTGQYRLDGEVWEPDWQTDAFGMIWADLPASSQCRQVEVLLQDGTTWNQQISGSRPLLIQPVCGGLGALIMAAWMAWNQKKGASSK